MHPPVCPKCHALHHLLIEAEPDVVRRGVEARARGPGFGVLVALPEDLGAETPDEAAELQAALELGYYVGVMSIDELIRMVPADGHDPDLLTAILRQLRRPPPEGQVHVLATLDGCVASITARANPEIAAARDRDAARMKGIGRLLGLAEPSVLRRADEQAKRASSVFVVAAPDDPALRQLRGVAEAAASAAIEAGVYVGLHDAADALAALPLEDLEAEDALRAARRLTAPIPAGSVRVAAVYDGQITTMTVTAGPGCLALKR
jgi:hypothetical protein